MDEYAVLDCGTNTFHLAIVKLREDQSWETVYKNRKFVYLAEDGIHTIGPKAYARGMKALDVFSKELRKHRLKGFRAVGTAALRNAHNADDFIQQANKKFGINIEIITGVEEAHLIQKGVSHYAPPSEFPFLIMDIGGGSVEFILLEKHQMLWSKSFEVGVSVLYSKFHNAEPISNSEKVELNSFLSDHLRELNLGLISYKNIGLLGAAGTFDVIENFGGLKIPGTECTQVNLDDFYVISSVIQKMNLNTRLDTPEIPSYRAEMIVVALLLIEYVLKSGDISNICIVMGDIKDGILLDLIN
ncbi:MAG TPA: hypothetical protein VK590_10285 [Saprospiraceae bacterium]|nr:hypothetical protein [Saprospiraceae bacterium]